MFFFSSLTFLPAAVFAFTISLTLLPLPLPLSFSLSLPSPPPPMSLLTTLTINGWTVGPLVGTGSCSTGVYAATRPDSPGSWVMKTCAVPPPPKSKKSKRSPAQLNADALYSEYAAYSNAVPSLLGLSLPDVPRTSLRPYGDYTMTEGDRKRVEREAKKGKVDDPFKGCAGEDLFVPSVFVSFSVFDVPLVLGFSFPPGCFRPPLFIFVLMPPRCSLLSLPPSPVVTPKRSSGATGSAGGAAELDFGESP